MNALQRTWDSVVSLFVKTDEKRAYYPASGVGVEQYSNDLARIFGLNWTGPVNVTEEGAMALAPVFACVRVLAESVAVLPWDVFRNTPEGKEKLTNHPVYYLLHNEPNSLMTSFEFRELLMAHVLLWGNAYARIIRQANERPESFKNYHPSQVTIVESKGELYYNFPDVAKPVPAYDVIHVKGLGFDGKMGRSPIRMQAESLGVNLAAQKFGGKFFQNGTHLGGILTTPAALSDKARTNLKSSWKFKHGGVDNVGEVAILEEGLDFKRIGIPPEEAQFLQTRQYSWDEICAMYRVPPHLTANLTRATFSNIEQQDLGFVKHSLMPWVVRIEQEFNRKAFRETEKGRIYNKLNVNGLLRGDLQSRAAFYVQMRQNGIFNADEIREWEEMNTLPDGQGKIYLVQQNMMPLDMAEEVLKGKNQSNETGNQSGTGNQGNTGE